MSDFHSAQSAVEHIESELLAVLGFGSLKDDSDKLDESCMSSTFTSQCPSWAYCSTGMNCGTRQSCK